METTAAVKNKTWKNLIMGQFLPQVKAFDDYVSSNHKPVFQQGRAPLQGWRQVQIRGTK